MSRTFAPTETSPPSYSMTYQSADGKPLLLGEDKPFAQETLQFEVISLRLLFRAQQEKIAEQQRVIAQLQAEMSQPLAP